MKARIDMSTANMHSAKLGFEALVDVGIIVIAHFRNPARKYVAQLLLDALTLRRRILIPVNTYLGAYIIMTRYLKLRRDRVAKALHNCCVLGRFIYFFGYFSICGVYGEEGEDVEEW